MLLIERLMAHQKTEKLSDTQFAAKIGLSYPSWSALKRGVMTPGYKTIRRVLAAYPDLASDVMEALTVEDATEESVLGEEEETGELVHS